MRQRTGFKIFHPYSMNCLGPISERSDLRVVYAVGVETRRNPVYQGPMTVFKTVHQAKNFSLQCSYLDSVILKVKYRPSDILEKYLWWISDCAFDIAPATTSFRNPACYFSTSMYSLFRKYPVGLCPPGTVLADSVTPVEVVLC